MVNNYVRCLRDLEGRFGYDFVEDSHLFGHITVTRENTTQFVLQFWFHKPKDKWARQIQ